MREGLQRHLFPPTGRRTPARLRMLGVLTPLLSVLAPLLGAGCQAEAPRTASFDRGVGRDAGVDAQALACASQRPLAAPVVDGLSVQPTTVVRKAIRGLATGAAQVLAERGDQRFGPVNVINGRFCLPVDLLTNTQNQLRLLARSAQGCLGLPSLVTVLQQGVAQLPPTTTGRRNAAMGMPTETSVAPSGLTQRAQITDGEEGTSVELGSLGVADIWVTVNLGTPQRIGSARLAWNALGGQFFATRYQLFLSNEALPGAPAATNPAWAMVVDETRGTAQPRDITVTPIREARWVGLLLIDDDAYLTDTYRLAELAVYAEGGSTGVGPTLSETCP
ncbi:MAG: hypothetical protein IPG96_10305 [Proteobacteria bacterium]|nr:hypothetical protein [Pseudomonadota bacterium]